MSVTPPFSGNTQDTQKLVTDLQVEDRICNGKSSKTANLILSVDLSCVHIRIERAVTVLERMPTSDMTV